MSLIVKNISKRYQINKDSFFRALKPMNLTFGSSGLVAIVGKSGSGKSTLLNLLAMIDTPSSGEIYLNGIPYSKYDKKHRTNFYSNEIGIVFQSYNLLDDLTAFENVEIASQISGKRRCKKQTKEALEIVGIKEELFNLKASRLSGGEKQKVSIARALINSPNIVLCDEPTGALDSDNSIKVMEILKDISKTKLVVIVSHNLPLVNKYADRIIELSDGKIIRDENNTKDNGLVNDKTNKKKNNSSWVSKLALKNYKKRIKRNLISSLAFTISLAMLYLVVGFISNKDEAVKNACYRQLNFGVGEVSIEVASNDGGTLSIVKQNRPPLETLMDDPKISKIFNICPNFSAILPQNIGILYDDEPLDDLLFTPIYSFNSGYIDRSLLLEDKDYLRDDLDTLIINEYARTMIGKAIKKDPLNEYVKVKHEIQTTYINEIGEYIIDSFIFERSMKIVAVCNEINYLPNAKLYYSYSALIEYMQDYILNNLSTYNGYDITWYDRVMNADDYSYLSGYSYLLFLKDINLKSKLFKSDIISSPFSYNSQSLLLSNSLLSFLQVAEYGLILFLAITFLGTIIILSIVSFTAFSEDHKTSAVLSSLGASDGEIRDIYLQESLLIGLSSYVVSIGASIGLSILINSIISSFINLYDLIKIPFFSFLGVKLLFPILVLISILVIVALSTLLPIYFSKAKTIKGELQNV